MEDDDPVCLIFKIRMRPREKLFWWRLYKDNIPTNGWLCRRGLSTDSSCPLGCGEVEDINHITYNCKKLRDVLTVLENWGLVVPRFCSFDELWDSIGKFADVRESWVPLYCVAVHQNWDNRNSVKHGKGGCSPAYLAANILEEAFHVGSRLDSFSGPGDFGLGADSPSAASVFGKDRGPFFDSVPSTPLFNSGFSPKFNEGLDDHSFNTFSRFDSFGMNDSTFPSSGTLARFDSMRSTTDQSHDAFSRFDSFRSMTDTPREFSRFESTIGTAESPRKTIARFDSIQSTADYNHGFSFDDPDPFGSGIFKTSESHTPKKNSDPWSSF
ncbi:uncharacterized protein LOC110094595 [Dendrobium catenatum]|uniref:uncharacterized protein LOC110094595 n=1 Tax=Dendrobium catenatum TaxID=906689 RepID=UPI0009F5D017|nr:uncharacterized protein LOC110094595 [Dendrobium catenatum]